MSALAVAGPEAGAGTHPLRQQIRQEIEAKNLPVVAELKQFFTQHRKRDAAADISQYMSLGLAVGEPPEFKPKFMTVEMPPDTISAEGVVPLLIRFYRDADIESLWRRSQPHIEKEIARYHEPVSRAVLEATSYLRNPTSGYMGRKFQIYLELLAPANQIHTRSYKDDYYIVVTPSAEPRIRDIRHAWLHYLLDPLATKFAAGINAKRSLLDIAEGAPLLEEAYKTDFLLLTTESLIRAIEARLESGSLEKRQQLVAQSLAEGYVLTPYFAEQLPIYEKQEQAMRLYFSDMIDAIDVGKEDKRLASVQFAKVRPSGSQPAEVIAPPVSAGERTLNAAEKAYADRSLNDARELYLKVVQQSSDKPLHARAYYGLARIAALEKKPDLAEALFHKTLELEPDPQTKSWTEVYLARLAEAAGSGEEAEKHYQAALTVQGASEGAQKAARQGLETLARKGK